MEFTNWFFVIISIGLYAFAGYIFIQFLLVLWKQMFPKLTSGKLTLQEILSMAMGIVILATALVYAPLGIARGIQKGWDNFMPVMMEISNGIVQDMQGMLDGTIGVHTTGTTTTVEDGLMQPVLTGSGIDPLTGQLYGDPNAGGGGGIIPTPIMPEMREPTPIPTPTLAPTATPFNPTTWTPDDPAPTPQG